MLAKCGWALRVWTPEPDTERYRDEDAEAYARRMLMPARLFRASADLPDELLAECFHVPIHKISQRRHELGAHQVHAHPGRPCDELQPPTAWRWRRARTRRGDTSPGYIGGRPRRVARRRR